MTGQRFTLAIFKPDVQRVLSFRKKSEEALLAAGLKTIAHAEVRMSRSRAEAFYSMHEGKFFYQRLVNYMISGPIGVYVLSGESAISKWRQLIGPTKVYRAVITDQDSLRGRFGLTDTRNGFHGSDGDDSARLEIEFFFPHLKLPIDQ